MYYVTKIVCRDDLNDDDIIGTCYLNVSEISTQGEKGMLLKYLQPNIIVHLPALPGFLPTFGPCFINCYGSPREYSDLPDKYVHLNKGLVSAWTHSYIVALMLLIHKKQYLLVPV